METTRCRSCRPGIGYEWTGVSLQEQLSGSQAPVLYAISILVVFLCLAALYESWSVPVSVMLVVPLGIIGALAAATARDLENDVYFQVGLLDDDGALGEERDSDRRVRRATSKRRASRRSKRPSRRRICGCGRS